MTSAIAFVLGFIFGGAVLSVVAVASASRRYQRKLRDLAGLHPHTIARFANDEGRRSIEQA